MRTLRPLVSMLVALIVSLCAARVAEAATIAVGTGAFGPGSTLTTFAGLVDGTEVNGLTVDGIVFSYNLGDGQLVIDGGPGVTNNVDPPNIVSFGNPTGTLSMTLLFAVDTFGYGFAVLNTVPVANATTISLFSGATNVGVLSYAGVLDPNFAGGFAGIQSTLLFDRVEVTFNSALAPAFALDNIRTFNSTAAPVPEPATLSLLGLGLAGAAVRRRLKR